MLCIKCGSKITTYSETLPEEWQEELEVRIGQRITEGLSKKDINYFKLMIILFQSEVTSWLEQHKPDYREIIAEAQAEIWNEYQTKCPNCGFDNLAGTFCAFTVLGIRLSDLVKISEKTSPRKNCDATQTAVQSENEGGIKWT